MNSGSTTPALHPPAVSPVEAKAEEVPTKREVRKKSVGGGLKGAWPEDPNTTAGEGSICHRLIENQGGYWPK